MAKGYKAYFRGPTGNVFGTYHPEYHGRTDAEVRLTVAEGKRAYREQSIELLRKRLSDARTQMVYTLNRSVSSSGMQRQVSCFIVEQGTISDVSGYVAVALDWSWDKTGGVVVDGCGMDMHFHLVSTLSRVLYPNHARPDYVLKHHSL